jgi:hypothetical protein
VSRQPDEVPTDQLGPARVGLIDTEVRIISRATTEGSSSHQSTSGTGSRARSEGLLIKPGFLYSRLCQRLRILFASAAINQTAVSFTILATYLISMANSPFHR